MLICGCCKLATNGFGLCVELVLGAQCSISQLFQIPCFEVVFYLGYNQPFKYLLGVIAASFPPVGSEIVP